MKIQYFLFILIFISSCDIPEHYFSSKPDCNENKSIKELSKKELIDYLQNKNPNEYRYFFKTFKDTKDGTFMLTNFRNNTDCFDIEILVDKWDKLGVMKKTNGKAYPKELYDLKWELKTIDGTRVVKYLDMHEIID